MNKIHYTLIIGFLCFSINLSGQSVPVGWAAANGGTTGGQGGQVVSPTTRNEFVAYCATPEPLIITVRDTIELVLYERVSVSANKTIIGASTNAMLKGGGLEINGDNVIVRNLVIGGSYDGDWDGKTNSTDAITIQSSNVWVDHCWLHSSADGLLDVRSASSTRIGDFVTVSYTRFSDHNKVSLIGSSDNSTQDRDHLRVTFHHCWWDGTVEKSLHQRLPRIRYGDVHLYNNYFEDIASYCTLARIESDVVIEYNYYRNSMNPHGLRDYGLGIKDPTLVARGNIYEYSGGEQDTDGEAWEPSEFYDYEIDSTALLPGIIMNEAGPFNPSGNNDPIAGDDEMFLETGERTFDLEVLDNDMDPDGDELRLGGIVNSPIGFVLIRNDELRYIGVSNPVQPDTIIYQVVDTKGGYAEGTLIVNFEGVNTSTKDLDNKQLIVFPNPARDRFYIKLPDQKINVQAITLSDISGKVFQISNSPKFYNNGIINISTSGLPTGYYHLNLKTDSGYLSKKVMIIH